MARSLRHAVGQPARPRNAHPAHSRSCVGRTAPACMDDPEETDRGGTGCRSFPAGHHFGHAAASAFAHAVAGDGIDHPCVLHAIRSRAHPFIPNSGKPALCRAHARHCGIDDGPYACDLFAGFQHPGFQGRDRLASRLPGGGGDRACRDCLFHRARTGAVCHCRAEAYPEHRPDCSSSGRGRFRGRNPARGNRFDWQHLAYRLFPL